MCATPLTLKMSAHGYENERKVPCGSCPICKKAKLNAWLFRLNIEAKNSINAVFLTLTYDKNNVPWTENGYKTLDKRDIQLFMKRLRFHGDFKIPIKYYFVGEYGSNTNRPHYHAILFNVPDDKLHFIDLAWAKGFTMFPKLTSGGIQYVLKYISKPRKKQHRDDDRQREFSLMSKGLGKDYITPSIIRYHNRGLEYSQVLHYTATTQFKIPMPRYYKNKIYTDEMQKEVSNFLNEYAQLAEARLIQQNPNKDVNLLLKSYWTDKQHIKFDKRVEKL